MENHVLTARVLNTGENKTGEKEWGALIEPFVLGERGIPPQEVIQEMITYGTRLAAYFDPAESRS